MLNPLQVSLGILLGVLIGWAAWRAGSLSGSGGAAAAVVGGAIFGLGGLAWAAALLAFFISSSLLSRLFSRRKLQFEEKFAKGARRDWVQVAANGGLGAFLAAVQAFLPDAAWAWPAFLGALATVNADTWATELGVLSRRPPRLITSGKIVEPGTSGGVSGPGTLAALAGAGLIGLLAPFGGSPGGVMFAAALAGGLAGSLFDSLLGATAQAIYYCPQHEKETEQHPHHRCGALTVHLRGWRWLNNDLVNFAASLAGAAVSMAIWAVLA